MPLTTRSPGQSPVDSSAINQFVSALTGVLTDQPFTFANNVAISSALSVTGAITGSSNFSVAGTGTITGKITGSSGLATSSNATIAGSMIASSQIAAQSAATSSQRIGIALGSSGPNIQFGSSIPTSACLVGSLFLNTGGSSTTPLYVCMPNGGTASSSNWGPFTFA